MRIWPGPFPHPLLLGGGRPGDLGPKGPEKAMSARSMKSGRADFGPPMFANPGDGSGFWGEVELDLIPAVGGLGVLESLPPKK